MCTCSYVRACNPPPFLPRTTQFILDEAAASQLTRFAAPWTLLSHTTTLPFTTASSGVASLPPSPGKEASETLKKKKQQMPLSSSTSLSSLLLHTPPLTFTPGSRGEGVWGGGCLNVFFWFPIQRHATVQFWTLQNNTLLCIYTGTLSASHYPRKIQHSQQTHTTTHTYFFVVKQNQQK